MSGMSGHGREAGRGPVLAAGVGARAGVTEGEVLALLRAALEAAGRRDPAVAVLATAETKAGEAGIAGAAARLGVPLVTYTAAELAAVDVPHPSRTVLGAAGTPSVAEAAALLAAGPGGALLVPKSASPRATVAVARFPAAPGPQPPPHGPGPHTRTPRAPVPPGPAPARTRKAGLP